MTRKQFFFLNTWGMDGGGLEDGEGLREGLGEDLEED
jgi:hypothetical protein